MGGRVNSVFSKGLGPLSLSVLVLLSLPVLGAGTPGGLSPHEEELTRRIGFDPAVVLIVKQEAAEHTVRRLVGFNEDGYQLLADGITATVRRERADRIRAALRRKLLARRYLVFLADENEETGTATIGVLRGGDQFEILRVMQTNGPHQDVKNEDVIEKLSSWHKRAPFEIIGAGYDWVEIEFLKLPGDMAGFVKDLYEFCPDAVDADGGAAEEKDMADRISASRRLSLWWD